MSITANYIPDAEPVYFINNTNCYIFTAKPDGWTYSDYFSKGDYKTLDPRIHPNVYKYVTHHAAYLNIGFAETVLLIPGNKLPFKQLTKGELLQLALESFDKHFEEKKKIKQNVLQNLGNLDTIGGAGTTDVDTCLPVGRVVLQLVTKYK